MCLPHLECAPNVNTLRLAAPFSSPEPPVPHANHEVSLTRNAALREWGVGRTASDGVGEGDHQTQKQHSHRYTEQLKAHRSLQHQTIVTARVHTHPRRTPNSIAAHTHSPLLLGTEREGTLWQWWG